ncbi:MAG TPA: ParB/RepB/Spo0J family partition protein [Candidatus Faecimonas intestinavium]|nr:ParB/RepB/Spo0J family partition protein [Candidatus Faecimonas intestinavium]
MENIKNGTPIKNNSRGTFIPLMRNSSQRLEIALNEAKKLVDEGLSYEEVLKKVDSRVLFVEDIEKLFEDKNREGNIKENNLLNEKPLEESEKEIPTNNEIVEDDEEDGINEVETNKEEMFTPKQLEETNNIIKEIDINSIYPNQEQARKEFNETEINELAKSIKHYGLLSPIIVTKTEENHYMIIAGERRWRACKTLNWDKIKCQVINNGEEDLDFISLIENFQRKDLNPIEKAIALNNVMSKYELTQEELAEKLGKARSTVTNILRILDLDSRVLDLLKEKKLTYKHCKTLLSIKDPEKQYLKALELIENDTPSTKVEEEVKPEEENEKLPPIYMEIEQKCQNIFGENLKIQARPKSKTVSFKFKTDEELEKFLNLLQK